ncbi:hypothetical protein CGLO_00632 [Colletotrichum gloeosporioides Cg-14]|nr:hypothetical protein CGLO_00632 [Colletotrichum gloeosporioides Cg-14]
MSDVEYY